MSRTEVFQTVSEIIHIVCDCNEIHEDTNLIDDLMLSSIETLHLIANLEGAFHIRIKNSDIRHLVTVEDIVNLIIERT